MKQLHKCAFNSSKPLNAIKCVDMFAQQSHMAPVQYHNVMTALQLHFTILSSNVRTIIWFWLVGLTGLVSQAFVYIYLNLKWPQYTQTFS